MRHVVVGTAGHVDHGKTALIKRLTGVDTDRLPEERARGMSIDIGLASCTLPSGRAIDFVDVPGHERFIRNMLCGVSGIDAAMFVVAADDGPMPQTEEHLDILTLLGVERGLVVMTKIDVVGDELLGMAIDETREALAGTALEHAPIVRASAKTGQGIEEIAGLLDEICAQVRPRDETRAFRLPIDRVISVPGAGTVVTGTVAAGVVRVGETLRLYPGELETRVRGMQSHGEDVQCAQVGDRVGVNLHGVEPDCVARGMTLAAPGSLSSTHLVNVKLTYLPRNSRPLVSGERVHVYAGTGEAVGRVVFMERSVLLPGEEGLAQLRLEKRLAPAPDDVFVVRSLSPLATIGGGVVLEAAARRYRVHHPSARAILQLLRTMDGGGRAEAVSKVLADSALAGCRPTDIAQRLALTDEAACDVLEMLVRNGTAVEPTPDLFVSARAFGRLKDDICDAVERRCRARPLEPSFAAEDIRARLARDLPREAWTHALAELAAEDRLTVKGSHVSLPGYVPVLSPRQKETMELIGRAFAATGLKPLWPSDICESVDRRSPQQVKTLVDFMISRGDLIRLANGAVLPADRVEEVIGIVTDHIDRHGAITLPQARDAFGIGRHPTQGILEHLDSRGITERIGDERVLNTPRARVGG